MWCLGRLTGEMPVIIRLRYCVITMYYNDHNPPYFHVVTKDGEAQVRLSTLDVMEGAVDRRALREAREWASTNKDLLQTTWSSFNP